MPMFRVVVEGRNFWLDREGGLKRLGFSATRYVDASDEEEAESAALDLLRADEALHGTQNDPGDLPEIFIEDVVELEPGEIAKGGKGYEFFADEREPDA